MATTTRAGLSPRVVLMQWVRIPLKRFMVLLALVFAEELWYLGSMHLLFLVAPVDLAGYQLIIPAVECTPACYC